MDGDKAMRGSATQQLTTPRRYIVLGRLTSAPALKFWCGSLVPITTPRLVYCPRRYTRERSAPSEATPYPNQLGRSVGFSSAAR